MFYQCTGSKNSKLLFYEFGFTSCSGVVLIPNLGANFPTHSTLDSTENGDCDPFVNKKSIVLYKLHSSLVQKVMLDEKGLQVITWMLIVID